MSIRAFDPDNWHWKIRAELRDGFQVDVKLDTTWPDKGYGPWSVISDEPPRNGGEGSGPSPVNLALGALAACTAVTVAGVIRRRGMPVQALRVEIESNGLYGGKAEAEAAAEAGGDVEPRQAVKRIIVTGDVSDEELAIIERTARHCPVSRMMEGGAVRFEEQVVRAG